MRVISDPNVLRQFERKTATVFSLLQNVVSAVGPLDANKLQDIVNELTIDRFNLAQELLASAQAQDVSKQEGQKNAISRGYYAMYHAGRTVIFHYERADVDSHEDIPKRLPPGLPNQTHWVNRLIEWRKRRNQVDYSPYPEGNLHTLAQQVILEAQDFIELCAQFLRGRGVSHA